MGLGYELTFQVRTLLLWSFMESAFVSFFPHEHTHIQSHDNSSEKARQCGKRRIRSRHRMKFIQAVVGCILFLTRPCMSRTGRAEKGKRTQEAGKEAKKRKGPFHAQGAFM